MIIVKSLSDWVDKVKDVNVRATYRALNKAASKTNTKLNRYMQKDLGVKAKDIRKRIYQKKASSKSLEAYVSIGTKYGFGLHVFSPRIKVVKKGNGKKARKYNGVAIKIPVEGGRFFVPKAFMAVMPRGKKSLVVARRGKTRLKIDMQTKDVTEIAKKYQASLTTFMQEDFKKQFSDQLKALT